MEITYLGHSAFKIKTKSGSLVTDPFGKKVGFSMPSVSADLVTISHRGHGDHEEVKAVSGTARRKEPFVIDQPGEYEIEGISVFGYQTYHDNVEGKERGTNTIYVIQAEDLRILHLGDLGHELSSKLIDELDGVDVLMVPVGGIYTIGAKEASELATKIDPTYIMPMHYRTSEHDQETFGKMDEVAKFVEVMGLATREVTTLSLTKASLPVDATEVITFS